MRLSHISIRASFCLCLGGFIIVFACVFVFFMCMVLYPLHEIFEGQNTFNCFVNPGNIVVIENKSEKASQWTM